MRWLLLALLAAASPALAAPPKPPAAVVDPWSAMIEKTTPAVVSIDVVSTRAFDTERAGHSYATGFVVDAERGIILTNRHVVEPGPVRSEAIFQDQEVVPLRAIYRDPVHDFGFYQFNPADLEYMKLVALPLDPSRARVGTEIRVLGNNAGEKLSIHTGTIARLDRDAPRYSSTGYNDFNTFYIQAAAGTTGGSSGSPVLDIDGTVVALNAGARRDSAASFYLPLDRVVRALDYVRRGEPVPRGNIQAVLGYTAYDELDRLGLSDATEAAARRRNPEGKGLLVVREVLPGGPADGRLMVGDVLVSVNGAPVDAFIPVEAALDDNVGRSVKFGIERGGKAMDVDLSVGDLHATAPSEYVEFGGDILHALSYQQARNYNVPAQGVYVASTGYSLKHGGVPEGVRIDSVGGTPVPDVDTLWRVLQALPEHARVEVRYTAMSEARRQQVAAILVDRTFFPMRRCARDNATGRWPCV
ncbi:MAG: trypsin-like peptidase domain-containing protein, partial [Deltaproteobacteria bacterium]|nr:trypsin-like peptidase domain-containing protein [Deltaproteobacteria bacterium]